MFGNNNIISKYLRRFHLPGDIQATPLVITPEQGKLLAVSIYRPSDQNLDYFLSCITDLFDDYLDFIKGFVIVSDFDAKETNPAMETFLNQHKCKKIIKSKICYRSKEGSCTYLIITSKPS